MRREIMRAWAVADDEPVVADEKLGFEIRDFCNKLSGKQLDARRSRALHSTSSTLNKP
jgi:hypothetical protein